MINQYEEKFHQAINDDLNMPLAMGIVWEVIKNEKKSKQLAQLLLKFDTVLGLKIDEEIQKQEKQMPQEVINLIEERKIARANKNWEKADELREKIRKMGYEVKDTKNVP